VCVRSGLASRVAAVLLVLGISATLGVSASAAEDPDITRVPRDLIDETAAKIVSILGREDEPADIRVGEIEKIAYDIFDFTTMSKLVLARNWRKLDKEQRVDFVREFKRNLSRTYGTRLDRYDQEDIEIFGTQIEPRNDVSVKTRIVGGQFDGAVISYRLR
jgi:ABC-type transporter MlaC component